MTKNRLSFILKALFSILILCFITSYLDLSQVKNILKQISTEQIIYAFTINIIGTILCKSFLVYLLISPKKKKLLINLVTINLCMRFYSVILPRGAVPVLRWYRYSQVCNAKKAFVILSFEATIYLLMSLMAAFIFIHLDDTGNGIQYLNFLYIMIFSTLIAVIILKWSVGYLKRFTTLVNKLNSLSLKLNEYIVTAKSMNLNSPKVLLSTFSLSFISFIFFILSSYILLNALNISLPLSALIWIRVVVMLIAMIPITIGGLGLREAGFVSLFALYAIQPEEAIIYSFATYGIQLIIASIGGIIELFKWSKNV
ncbi:MAG: flippase-like domain-containing protein [Colwellia sp.]|nr:flippase-like domain-containing protein [Colwellia sp.]